MRVVINGNEVKNPIVRFLFGLLALLLFTAFGLIFVLLVLPLIGMTLGLSLAWISMD